MNRILKNENGQQNKVYCTFVNNKNEHKCDPYHSGYWACDKHLSHEIHLKTTIFKNSVTVNSFIFMELG